MCVVPTQAELFFKSLKDRLEYLDSLLEKDEQLKGFIYLAGGKMAVTQIGYQKPHLIEFRNETRFVLVHVNSAQLVVEKTGKDADEQKRTIGFITSA